jgi:hypothetical protein
MSLNTNMSLDNTSHPGRAAHDELVPSRYALQVGDIDVMVVSDGVLSLPTEMLAHNADPAVRAAWLGEQPVRMGCGACLRERAGKPVSKCRSICFLGSRT